MNEFIEKLIERLEEERHPELFGGWYSIRIDKAIEIVNQLAEEYVPETNVGKWITCSERLPEKEGKYLVFLERWNTITFSKFKDVMGYKHFDNGYVIAWQPLPEPYKPEQQKEIPTDHYIERFNRIV